LYTLVYIRDEENHYGMMSITTSPEAETLKNTIIDLIDISDINVDILMQALCALVIDYMNFYMDESADLVLLQSQLVGVPQRT
jgi:hypothetical protein